jgi:hypothetical protein
MQPPINDFSSQKTTPVNVLKAGGLNLVSKLESWLKNEQFCNLNQLFNCKCDYFSG